MLLEVAGFLPRDNLFERRPALVLLRAEQRRDTGAWIGPCIGVTAVNKSLSWTYSGRCDTPGINVPISNVSTFRICSAVNGDWAHARCGATPYDGKAIEPYLD